jgi:hypothetical protein
LSSGDTVSRVSPRSKRQRQIDRVFGGVALVVAAVVVVGFGVYVAYADGAARFSALFAGGLVLVGVWLIVWSYVRRPPRGQGDEFLDKFLAGVGQALLLGAVLSFGFGIVGQRLENEQKTRDEQQAAEQKTRDEQRAAEQAAVDLRRDLAGQVRTDAGGSSFRGVDLVEQSFVGLDLSGFDFSGANLSHADLSVAVLTDANLFDANLTGAELTFADLTSAFLFSTDLTGADLTEVDLTGADLTFADLTDADLTDAMLLRADLTDADLTDADLTGVVYDEHTVWPDGFEPPPMAELPEE